MANLLRVRSPQPPRRSAPNQYFVQVFGANRTFNWGDCRALNQSFAVKVTLGDETQSEETTLKPPHSVDWNRKLIFTLPTPAEVDANNNNPEHPIKLQVTFKSGGFLLATNEVITVGTARSTTRELRPAQDLASSNKKWVKLLTPAGQESGAAIQIMAGFVHPSGSTPKVKTPEPTAAGSKHFRVDGHDLIPQLLIRNRHGSGGQTLKQAVQTTEASKRRSGSLRDIRAVDDPPTVEAAFHRSLRVRFASTSTPDLAAIAARGPNEPRPRVLFETFTLSPDHTVARADPIVVPLPVPVGLVLPIYGNVSLATGGPTEDEKKQDDQDPTFE